MWNHGYFQHSTVDDFYRKGFQSRQAQINAIANGNKTNSSVVFFGRLRTSSRHSFHFARCSTIRNDTIRYIHYQTIARLIFTFFSGVFHRNRNQWRFSLVFTLFRLVFSLSFSLMSLILLLSTYRWNVNVCTYFALESIFQVLLRYVPLYIYLNEILLTNRKNCLPHAITTKFLVRTFGVLCVKRPENFEMA